MSTLFHDNRRLLILLVVLILAWGGAALRGLPRMEDPELTARNAVVLTRLPGASAERVEALITEKLEDELAEVEEIKLTESSSRAGISIVQIELHDSVSDVDTVWSRVRDLVDDARQALPTTASKPDLDVPSVQAFTLISAIVWERAEPVEHGVLRRLAEDLEHRLRGVPGTADVEVFGQVREEVVVDVRTDEAAATGLSTADIAAAVGRADAKVAAGQVRGTASDLMVEVAGEVDGVARVAETPLRYGASGDVLRIADVADVRKGNADPRSEIALIDGREGVAVAARMESGDRVDLWAEDARAVVAKFESRLPAGVTLQTVFDQSRYTDDRLDSLTGNLMLGAVLVAIVVWLMMGWRSAIVIVSALPLASLLVFGGLDAVGMPLHQFSITGLIIALGLLIDTAIVMVDEVRHHIAAGESPREAVRRSVKALSVPLLGSTVTSILAFSPLLLMPGAAGEFVGGLSVSVVLALIGSFALSLTLVPALAAMLGGSGSAGAPHRWWRDGVGGSGIAKQYRSALGWLLRRPLLGIGFAVILPAIGFLQAGNLVEQFFPPADRDQFHVELRMPVQASIAETRRTAEAARELLLAEPGVDRVHWFVGGAAPKFYYNIVGSEDDTASYAQALVQLDRAEGARARMRSVQRRLDAALPAGQFVVRQLEQGPPFNAPIELRIYGPDMDELARLGESVRAVLAKVPAVAHTGSTLSAGRPKLHVALDEEQANRAGLTAVELAGRLDADLEGAYGGSLIESTEELPVRVRAESDARSAVGRVAGLPLALGTDARGNPRWTPLGTVAELELVSERADIPRRRGERVNVVHGYLDAGTLPETARAEFSERLATSGFDVPPGYRTEFGGETAERDRALGNMFSSVALLAVLMGATLVLSLGSFRMAAVIATVAGLSVGLTLAALWGFSFPFGFMAIVGALGLIGVAVNDAIVVLTAIRTHPDAGRGDVDATADVVSRSTRHILATTLTTIAGFTPLVLGGGSFWPPLAIAIAGGIAGATVLALTFVPSAFLLLRPAPVPARA